jgi:hypothetical protein
MEYKTSENWPIWVGLGLAAITTYRTINRPSMSEDGAIIWLIFMVGLPTWGLLKFEHPAAKKFMVAILAFGAFITIAPDKGGRSCDIEFINRDMPVSNC